MPKLVAFVACLLFSPPGAKTKSRYSKRRFLKYLEISSCQKFLRKLGDDDPSPLGAADWARLIGERPRDPEVHDMHRKLSGAGPLPPR